MLELLNISEVTNHSRYPAIFRSLAIGMFVVQPFAVVEFGIVVFSLLKGKTYKKMIESLMLQIGICGLVQAVYMFFKSVITIANPKIFEGISAFACIASESLYSMSRYYMDTTIFFAVLAILLMTKRWKWDKSFIAAQIMASSFFTATYMLLELILPYRQETWIYCYPDEFVNGKIELVKDLQQIGLMVVSLLLNIKVQCWSKKMLKQYYAGTLTLTMEERWLVETVKELSFAIFPIIFLEVIGCPTVILYEIDVGFNLQMFSRALKSDAGSALIEGFALIYVPAVVTRVLIGLILIFRLKWVKHLVLNTLKWKQHVVGSEERDNADIAFEVLNKTWTAKPPNVS